MTDQCLNPEELAELAAEDPRRAHVEGCPRCQAIMTSFASFMDPADIPAGADLKDANARLSAALDREIGGAVVRPAPTFWTPFRVRALASVAAVVIVAVGLSLVRPGSKVMTNSEPVLRGMESPVAPFRIDLARLDDGRFQLNWSPVEEATGYRVVIYGEDLGELAGFEVGAAITFSFEAPVGAAFCRVIAFRDGDELMKSEPVYPGAI